MCRHYINPRNLKKGHYFYRNHLIGTKCYSISVYEYVNMDVTTGGFHGNFLAIVAAILTVIEARRGKLLYINYYWLGQYFTNHFKDEKEKEWTSDMFRRPFDVLLCIRKLWNKNVYAFK